MTQARPAAPPVTAQKAQVKLSKAQALAIGKKYSGSPKAPPVALLASFTDIASLATPKTGEVVHPVQNVVAWIITFTGPLMDVTQGRPGNHSHDLWATHFNLVLNAQTGSFVYGFFTK